MSATTLPRQLSTERLTLRPFCFDDVDDVVEYANDEEWSRYLPGPPYPYRHSDAIQFLARHALADWALLPAWAACLSGKVIGAINLRFRYDHRVADIGWSLHRAFWRRGFATEMARVVVDSAFLTHDELARIGAVADLRNVPSQRVMEKLGMRREGTLRQARLLRGALCDEVCYGLLRSEWNAAAP